MGFSHWKEYVARIDTGFGNTQASIDISVATIPHDQLKTLVAQEAAAKYLEERAPNSSDPDKLLYVADTIRHANEQAILADPRVKAVLATGDDTDVRIKYAKGGDLLLTRTDAKALTHSLPRNIIDGRENEITVAHGPKEVAQVIRKGAQLNAKREVYHYEETPPKNKILNFIKEVVTGDTRRVKEIDLVGDYERAERLTNQKNSDDSAKLVTGTAQKLAPVFPTTLPQAKSTAQAWIDYLEECESASHEPHLDKYLTEQTTAPVIHTVQDLGRGRQLETTSYGKSDWDKQTEQIASTRAEAKESADRMPESYEGIRVTTGQGIWEKIFG